MSIKRLQAMKAKKGFTLVELIIVIAIIAVLAAILIPLLMGYIRSSRCSAAIGDAKSAHNLAAEAGAAVETNGGTLAAAATAAGAVTGLPAGVTMRARTNGNRIDIMATHTTTIGTADVRHSVYNGNVVATAFVIPAGDGGTWTPTGAPTITGSCGRAGCAGT